MKIGIYNKFLYVAGGGERHSLAIAEILSKNHDVDYIANKKVAIEDLNIRFNINLDKVNFIFLPDETDDSAITEITEQYDVFINATHKSSVSSKAKKSFLLVFFPHRFDEETKNKIPDQFRPFKYLFKSKQTIYNFLDTYNVVWVNSRYTQKWTKRYWRINSKILYPPIDSNYFAPFKKKDHIISVGRFFDGDHNKKHIDMINAFKTLFEDGLKNWQYHIIGGTDYGEIHQNYLKKVNEACMGYPIFIHTDISYKKLQEFYREAKIFWHATGFGENPIKNPQNFEHFGITIVEAMNSGCIPVTFGMGGPLEIVKNGKNGFTWKTLNELKEKTEGIINNDCLQNRLANNLSNTCKQFNKCNFENNLITMLESNNVNI